MHGILLFCCCCCYCCPLLLHWMLLLLSLLWCRVSAFLFSLSHISEMGLPFGSRLAGVWEMGNQLFWGGVGAAAQWIWIITLTFTLSQKKMGFFLISLHQELSSKIPVIELHLV